MTLVDLFLAIQTYKVPIIVLVLAAPWVTYLVCYLIPGKREEPLLLSLNLGVSIAGLLLLAGYLAYTTNTGGWKTVVQQADLFLLLLPFYHLTVSLWLSRRRVPLQTIPAFRTLQGLALLAGVFLVVSWLTSRIYFLFFTYLPFTWFLGFLALLLGMAYVGYRKLLGRDEL